jgi:hypothetical protein
MILLLALGNFCNWILLARFGCGMFWPQHRNFSAVVYSMTDWTVCQKEGA